MQSQSLSMASLKLKNQRSCPECGSQMAESYRCHENDILFIWYECSKEKCNGQWLQKEYPKSIAI